jgi:hypothetical protein
MGRKEKEMSKKIEIKKVVIQIGDKEAELTIEQARELKDALIDLLGKKETVYLPASPVVIERPYYPHYPNWTVTWDGTRTNPTTYPGGTITYSLSQ